MAEQWFREAVRTYIGHGHEAVSDDLIDDAEAQFNRPASARMLAAYIMNILRRPTAHIDGSRED
jgi:hypothetical protein